jgi:hypothetical protein
MDSFGLGVLSDELRRADARSGVRGLSGKVFWETVGQIFLPHFHFLLANLRVFVGIIFLRLSTFFLYFITGSFIHPFLAGFNSAIDCLASLTYFCCFLPNFYMRFSMLSVFNAPRTLGVGPLPRRIIFFLILITTFLIYFLLMFPGRTGGLEPHVVPRKLRRIQKDIWYHSCNDL